MPLDDTPDINHRKLEFASRFDVRETEKIILGAILLDPDLFAQTKVLGVMDFAAPFHRAVFSAMLELAEDGERLDPFLIFEVFKRDGLADWTVASITNLTYGLPCFSDIRDYVRIVRENAMTLGAVRKTENLVDLLAGKKITVKEFCERSSALVSELRGSYAEETDSFRPLSLVFQEEVLPVIDEYFKSETSEFLVSSGFREIDTILGGGYYPSDFVAIVAPPKSAKSAVALQKALRIAKNFAAAGKGESVALLSLEMSNLQNALRLIAQESFAQSVERIQTDENAISANWIRPGMLEKTYRRASEIASQLFLDNFFICQKPLTWKEIQEEVRRLAKENGLRVLVVDYWQLIENEVRGSTRTNNLADIAKGLKRLGQELGIVVIALGQFNQEGLKNREKTGELSTLYLEGSGELVKSANIVITIDIEAADLSNSSAPRRGTMTFKPLRSAGDARLQCLFFGKFLTVEII